MVSALERVPVVAVSERPNAKPPCSRMRHNTTGRADWATPRARCRRGWPSLQWSCCNPHGILNVRNSPAPPLALGARSSVALTGGLVLNTRFGPVWRCQTSMPALSVRGTGPRAGSQALQRRPGVAQALPASGGHWLRAQGRPVVIMVRMGAHRPVARTTSTHTAAKVLC